MNKRPIRIKSETYQVKIRGEWKRIDSAGVASMASNARIEASLVSVGSSMKNEQLCMIARQKWTGKGRQILV